jgi:hypothetical protein
MTNRSNNYPMCLLGFRYGNLVKYKELSHNLAVYPFATAHTFERLPRLFLLLKGLPEVRPHLFESNRSS